MQLRGVPPIIGVEQAILVFEEEDRGFPAYTCIWISVHFVVETESFDFEAESGSADKTTNN